LAQRQSLPQVQLVQGQVSEQRLLVSVWSVIVFLLGW
jgi:hypothetical protein